MKKTLTTILIILFITCSLLLGDPKDKRTEKVTVAKGKLAGKVTDDKENPIPSANISVMDGETIITSKTTKKNGSYIIAKITPGVYDVLCQRDGFETQKITGVEIQPDLTTIINITMSQEAIEIEGMNVIENKGEIKYPTKTNSGSTITATEIKDKPAEKIIVEEDLDESEADDIEIIETIGETSLDPYEEMSSPTEIIKVKKTRSPSKVSAASYSGLKAGFVDDNKQFNYFLNFLEEYNKRVISFPINITERIILNIKDGQGKPLPDAKLQIFAGKDTLESGLSYADGRYLFFPTEYDKNFDEYRLEVEYSGITEEVMIYRQGKRELDISMANIQKASAENIPLDILFILDTTGSMGEEIRRLRNSIEIINLNISEISPKPEIRYGMVLYRDVNDVYNTKIIPLNKSLPAFQEQLFEVSSGGGGDSPENLQAALEDALTKISWRDDGVKLAFIITDAPPHLDYKQDYTYKNAVHDAKRKGVKLFSIGTGGLPLDGEYVLRQISQYTFANYVFLTYGERGESEGGAAGSVSHHTGENFQTDKLEAIIIRKVKEELHNYLGKPLSGGDEYLQATKIDDEKNEVTLEKLFSMAITQLLDYSSIKIENKTPAAVLPIICSQEKLKTNAEYFTANLLLSFSKTKTFKAIERNDLQKIIEEQKLQLTGLTDMDKAVEVGKIMGAEMLIAGELYEKEAYFELYVKLLNVKTAEVLSVTKTQIDKSLGL
ncbi:MAG: carboxypeptidase regulatory-like domain-containing protein [Candidatus Cloacimonetes bacterium]|nr:carboxypeptidase regulatory-like domain-containing protein [Candidatus Cloacimonadota bacterium]